MNISIIEDIILNIILITFPILIYQVILCYKENINKSNNDLLLNIALISSLYLCIRFGITKSNDKVLLFCNIPIVIAYMKKNTLLGIILSIINITYCYLYFDSILLIKIIKYVSYFILYICAKKRKLSTNSFILSIAILQGSFLSFEYFFNNNIILINKFIELILLVFIYYFISFSIVYIFKVIDKIQTLNNSIKILEKDKEIKNALFKLTHEIKNPLAVCKGYLDMIDIEKKDKAEKYIRIMKQEINRSLNIMSDFVEFNKIKIKKEPLDLNMLLEDIYDSFKIIANNKKINLIYNEREDEELFIEADYERLKQVIINLLKNSYEATEKSGKIEIFTNIYKKYIDIVIEDNGIGMDDETLNKVKEMFFTTKESGTGLGVALSNEIIKAHNGEIIYYSKLNKGTKATIRLPI